MVLVGSRFTFIGILGGVDNFVANINSDEDLCHQRCVGRDIDVWCGGLR